MDVAIRWSPHSSPIHPRFLIIDVAGNRLRLCQANSVEGKKLNYKQLSQRDKLPNFTAFDWSKVREDFVALGGASGEATLLQIDSERSHSEYIHSFPIKHQRKCNSVAFSTQNFLATGLDRVRNDFCMNIYDLNSVSPSQPEPYTKLASSEAITSIKFFNSQPNEIVAGVARQCLRIYDLRDSAGIHVASFPTRQVHNIAIDPLDENYFISAGGAGDPVVSVWDRRYAARSNPSTPSDGSHIGPVLELRPAVDNTQSAAIWTLRFSGTKRGCFGILSSTGEVKIVELAQHSVRHGLQTPPINPHGGAVWNSPHYTRFTHTLQYPWYHGHQESSRVVAFDFMAAGSPVDNRAAVGLHTNREVELLNVPSAPPHVRFTAIDEIFRNREAIVRPSPRNRTVAEDLLALQRAALKSKQVARPASRSNKSDLAVRFGKLSMENLSHKEPSTQELPFHRDSSRELHEELLTLGYPETKLSLPDTLSLLQVQRRRCQEGYALNCQRNKDIVQNDPWLVELWDLIKRMEDLAKDDGMVYETLDLSYLGIASIWEDSLGRWPRLTNRNFGSDEPTEDRVVHAVRNIAKCKELPEFKGVQTRYPQHRQLCLAICGWTLSKQRLREKCKALIEQGDYYKAIVSAVFKGHKDVALELLKYAVQQKSLQNVGLGAVIACDSVNEEQRALCGWMAEETTDPYLKALLAYFISGDWNSVTGMPQLSLTDRVGVALKYLDDKRLGEFVKIAQQEALIFGNIEGVILTGLGERAMDLFEHYIQRFGDLQTAVCVMARTNPLYVRDARWELWKETYFMQMQAWRLFIERTRFVVQHNDKSVNRTGRCLNPQSPRQVALRCSHCHMFLARRANVLVPLPLERPRRPPKPSKTPPELKWKTGAPANAGLVCPSCGRHMPRCGICMMWLGTPDPSKPAAAAMLAEEGPDARQLVFCMNCNHCFHGHHARDWFARHQTCPVPDCQCMCGVLR